MLYPTEIPGIYAADFGGVTVQADTGHRTISMFAWLPGATDENFDQAEAVLSSLGVVGFTGISEIEDGLIVAESVF